MSFCVRPSPQFLSPQCPYPTASLSMQCRPFPSTSMCPNGFCPSSLSCPHSLIQSSVAMGTSCETFLGIKLVRKGLKCIIFGVGHRGRYIDLPSELLSVSCGVVFQEKNSGYIFFFFLNQYIRSKPGERLAVWSQSGPVILRLTEGMCHFHVIISARVMH